MLDLTNLNRDTKLEQKVNNNNNN